MPAKEEIPPNLPVLKGKPVTISCFVDASHACDVVTRHSQTGILIFLNQAPNHWYSKTHFVSNYYTSFLHLYISGKKAKISYTAVKDIWN